MFCEQFAQESRQLTFRNAGKSQIQIQMIELQLYKNHTNTIVMECFVNMQSAEEMRSQLTFENVEKVIDLFFSPLATVFLTVFGRLVLACFQKAHHRIWLSNSYITFELELILKKTEIIFFYIKLLQRYISWRVAI